MIKVNLDKAAYVSLFPGIGDFSGIPKTLSLSVPSMTLDGTAIPGQQFTVSGNIDIERSYALDQTVLQLDGLDNVFHLLNGSKTFWYTGTNRGFNPLSEKYQVEVLYWYDDDKFQALVRISTRDFTDSSINIPAFTARFSIRLFLPPFEPS